MPTSDMLFLKPLLPLATALWASPRVVECRRTKSPFDDSGTDIDRVAYEAEMVPPWHVSILRRISRTTDALGRNISTWRKICGGTLVHDE